ncbi:hypothetical protein BBP00_00007356, partial [Phytophthora kernoviae]
TTQQDAAQNEEQVQGEADTTPATKGPVVTPAPTTSTPVEETPVEETPVQETPRHKDNFRVDIVHRQAMGKDIRGGLTVRKVVVLLVNMASAVLTLLTGLRENPVIVFATGRYDAIRARLHDKLINYRLVRDDLVDVDTLMNLTTVGERYRFFSAPTRKPENLGEDKSTCLRVNSINVSHTAVYFDDFWGVGARRAQYYFHSISAPRCDIINFTPDWFDECVTTQNNSTDNCHRFILDHFDDLQENRSIQSGVPGDFGIAGMPFLRCVGRPDSTFTYMTDLLVHQSFWAGGSYHLEIQSSKCNAVPRLINSDKKYGLFQTEPVDHQAEVKVAIDNTGWFTTIVTNAYGIVTLGLISRGILNTIFQVRVVSYVPAKLRFNGLRRFLRYIVPFSWVSTWASEDDSSIIRFKGKVIMASDVWINHWLYIVLSILDALVSIRMTYSIYEMGTWMLSVKVTAENFIFLASALTRLTWLMCFAHTGVRILLKVAIRSMKAMKMIRPHQRDALEWWVDASALFVSYKMYSLMLCFLLYMLMKFHGGTTFMVNPPYASRGIFGGAPEIGSFWSSEIMCDFTVILAFLMLGGGLFGSIMLTTKYKYAANNNLLRLIQQRYVFVGWDVATVMESLGIDPFDDTLIQDGVATTNCSLGCIIQQMYQSGPSGHFTLAVDYLFHGNGFSAGPFELHYLTKKALMMRLLRRESSISASSPSKVVKARLNNLPATENKSLFDKDLRIFAESTYGRVILVEEDVPGKFGKNASGLLEYSVVDALSMMNILDIKHLLSNTKKLKLH